MYTISHIHACYDEYEVHTCFRRSQYRLHTKFGVTYVMWTSILFQYDVGYKPLSKYLQYYIGNVCLYSTRYEVFKKNYL
jgi:hypothetical protein